MYVNTMEFTTCVLQYSIIEYDRPQNAPVSAQQAAVPSDRTPVWHTDILYGNDTRLGHPSDLADRL